MFTMYPEINVFPCARAKRARAKSGLRQRRNC